MSDFRLPLEVKDMIIELAQAVGTSQVAIVEEAVKRLYAEYQGLTGKPRSAFLERLWRARR